MTIKYRSDETFHDGIYACLTRGMTFAADHETLTITLLGGY